MRERNVDRYTLNGKVPTPEPNLFEWAKWMEDASRVVARTEIEPGVQVSTVFLGLDHSFGRGTAPILFETMVFGGEHDQDQYRYCTWEEAEAGHKRVVAELGGSQLSA